MKRVAVFGNAGGGKSTLARHLAEITRLPLHVVDMLRFKPGGEAVPREEYLKLHRALLGEDTWIIDGHGDIASDWERFGRADTLVYVDLPLPTHYWRVTKRLIKGLFADPAGWPENSPLWSSTFSSYRVIPLHRRLMTPKYRQFVVDMAASKRVHHLKSPRAVTTFLDTVRSEYTREPPER
jgi:adenylate kinase family enzyme